MDHSVRGKGIRSCKPPEAFVKLKVFVVADYQEFDKFHSELSELAVMLVNYARDLQDHTHIVEVNAGALSSYAVSQYGELWVMGDGSHGQLGSGATVSGSPADSLLKTTRNNNAPMAAAAAAAESCFHS